MSVTFPAQEFGQVADPDFINAVAAAVARNDAQLDALGVGLVAGVEVRTTATLATSGTGAPPEVAITAFTLTAAPVRAGRRYKHKARIRYASTVAGDELTFRLRDGAATGALLGEDTGATAKTANTGYIRLIEFPYEPTATGPKTLVLTVQRTVGTGSCTVVGAGASNPTCVELYDVSPAAAVTKVT